MKEEEKKKQRLFFFFGLAGFEDNGAILILASMFWGISALCEILLFFFLFRQVYTVLLSLYGYT